jgi:hypothetical protein
MKQLLIENEKLIIEINRISQLMGQNLITEGVAKNILEFIDSVFPTLKVNPSTTIDNIVNNQPVRETISQLLDRVQQKVANAKRLGRPLPLSNVIQDLYVLAQRDTNFLVKLTDYIMSQNAQIRPYMDQVLRNVDRTKSKSEIIDNIRDGMNDAFNQAGVPAGPYTDAIVDRAVYDYEFLLKFPEPSLFSKILSKLPIRDAKILSNMMYNAFLPLAAKQSNFIRLSNEGAEYMAKTNKVPKQALDNMLAILASTKKWWDQQPRIVLNNWKRELRNDPNSRVSDEVLKELDDYVQTGGKEIWEEVAKTDKKFYDVFSQWKALWPFKRPKTPGGAWIFSGKLATKEYWERVIMTILFKSPETFKDWYKFLNSQGMASGTAQILATKALSMFVVLPTLETLLKSLIGNSEGLRNSLMDPDVDWVDWTDWSTEWTANMNNNFFTQIKSSDWGEFIDDRTWANEVAYVFLEIIEALDLSDRYDGWGQNEKRIQEEIENMEGVPEAVKDAFRKGKPAKTTSPPSENKNKKKIIPIGGSK